MSSVVARSRLVVAVAAASLAFFGCGGDDPRLSSLEVTRLVQQVDVVRALADNGDRDAALDGLAALRRDVDELAAKMSLAGPDARRIRRRIAGAERALKAQAQPAPSATPTPTAAPVEEDQDEAGDGKGKAGKGKGKGKSKQKGGRGR